MEANFWVCIEAQKKYNRWHAGSIKCVKNKPDTHADEVAIKITVDIPDAYFETPVLAAKITVPEDAIGKTVITPEVQDNISEIISQQLGVNVHVSAAEVQNDE